jgi:hypothetical protein
VPLEIEKDSIALLHERADDVRAFGGEEATADLEPTGGPTQRVGERDRLGARLHVERD